MKQYRNKKGQFAKKPSSKRYLLALLAVVAVTSAFVYEKPVEKTWFIDGKVMTRNEAILFAMRRAENQQTLKDLGLRK